MHQTYICYLCRGMTTRKSIHFIINPISGTTRKTDVPRLIKSNLDSEKFDCRLTVTTYAGQAAEIARCAKEQNTDVVVAVGGDGTVNEVARSIVGSQTALGIIPRGSGNGLARHLMLPLDVKGAINVINRCEIHDLDYGLINDKPFFCTCGMGFDAYVSEKFAVAGKRGLATYVEQVFREGMRYKPETYVIEDAQGNKTTYKALLVSCANASQYGNNAYIAPQASMHDGLLDVIVMEPLDLIEAPQVVMDMMNKTLDKNPKIKTFCTNEITIHREASGYIHYDGDPTMSSADVHIKLVNKGVKMIVNATADKSRRKPNALQTTFSGIFNDFYLLREGGIRQSHYLQELHSYLINKINTLQGQK